MKEGNKAGRGREKIARRRSMEVKQKDGRSKQEKEMRSRISEMK